jgi:hypothetical protein
MRLRAGLLYRAPSDVATGDIAREKPLFGPVQTPPVAKDFQQLCREHHIAVLLALCVGEIYVAMVSQMPAFRASS